MIYRSYEEQRSFPEYIDFVVRDLVDKPVRSNQMPIVDLLCLADLIREGYFPEFVEYEDLPKWLVDEEVHKISFRRIKKYAKYLFERFGEEDKAKSIHDDFDLALSDLKKQKEDKVMYTPDEFDFDLALSDLKKQLA